MNTHHHNHTSYGLQAADYLYGINGKDFEPQTALSLLRKGEAAGEACSLLDLATLYEDGVYLPYNPHKAQRYQLQAVEMGSIVAKAVLLTGGMDEQGRIVPEEQQKELLPRLIDELSVPNEVDDDDLRYLWMGALFEREKNWEQALAVFHQIQNSGLRTIQESLLHGIKEINGLADETLSEEERISAFQDGEQELRALLTKPCGMTGAISYMLASAFENEESPLYDAEKAQEYRRLGALAGDIECHTELLLQDLQQKELSGEERLKKELAISELTRFGHYGKPDDDALPGVTLSIEKPLFSCMHMIAKDSKVKELFAQGCEDDIFRLLYKPFGPEIRIENTLSHLLENLTLSLHCEDGHYSCTIARLEAGEVSILTPGMGELKSWPLLIGNGYLELSDGLHHSFCKLAVTHTATCDPGPCLPLLVTVETDTDGENTLFVQNLENVEISCVVKKLVNEATAEVSLQPRATAQIGKSDFSDNSAVSQNDSIIIHHEAYSDMACALLEWDVPTAEDV